MTTDRFPAPARIAVAVGLAVVAALARGWYCRRHRETHEGERLGSPCGAARWCIRTPGRTP